MIPEFTCPAYHGIGRASDYIIPGIQRPPCMQRCCFYPKLIIDPSFKFSMDPNIEPKSYDADGKSAQAWDTEMSRVESSKIAEQFELQGDNGTHRKIKQRHAQMMAIGGSIGSSLLVNTGEVLAIGGPLFLLFSYVVMSFLAYAIITAIVEIGAFLPVAGGSMAFNCKRYLSPSVGFALGWLYFYSFALIIPYEVTVSTLLIDYWPNNVPIAAWITVMGLVIISMGFFPVRVYAESEFWLTLVKVIMILGLLILSLVIMCGGSDEGVVGFRNWSGDDLVLEYLVSGAGGRFTAFLECWVISGFSFYFAPEMLVQSAGEMHNPRKSLPKAARRYFYRLIFFYILGALAIGITCRSDASGLLSGSGNANASPWVIAIREAGYSVLPSIINTGILLSAWSASNAYMYLSSRTLYSLAMAGDAPKIFKRCTKSGIPLNAVIASSSFFLLAYMNVGAEAGKVFGYLVDITNSSGLTSWIVCCIIFFRFRKACQFHGVTVPYKSRFQPYASYVAIFLFSFLLLANGFTVFYPGDWSLSSFLTNYIGIPIFILLWLGHKLTIGRKDPWFLSVSEIDMTTGLQEIEADAELCNRIEEMEIEAKGEKPKWLRVLTFLWD
jgi:yeast amino acid transporter